MQYVAFTTDTLARNNSARVYGYVIAATTEAVVNIIDGVDDQGVIVMQVNVGENATATFAGLGIPFDEGVYVEVVSGSVVGSVFVE